MAKKIEIPGKEVIGSFENLSLGSKMLSRDDKRAEGRLKTVRNSTLTAKKGPRKNKYSFTLRSSEPARFRVWPQKYGSCTWRLSEEGDLHLIQTNAEEGYGKFIILGSLLFFTSPKYRPRPSYRNIELNVLSWQGINFWARLLGFKHRNTLIKHVLATEGGKCTFIIAKKGSGVPAYVAVGSMEDIKLMIGQRLEKISEDICDMTIPYEICVSALKKVWEYREK